MTPTGSRRSALRALSGALFERQVTRTQRFLWICLAGGLGTGTRYPCLHDFLLSDTAARKAAHRSGLEFARQLLEVNDNRVLGDFNNRIIESRRSVESALKRTLIEVVFVAEAAAARACEIRKNGKQAISNAASVIDAQVRALEELVHSDGVAP